MERSSKYKEQVSVSPFFFMFVMWGVSQGNMLVLGAVLEQRGDGNN